MQQSRPYQVVLYCGPTRPALEKVRVVDLTPAEPTPEAVLATLAESGLRPADLRSRVLVVLEGTTPEQVSSAVMVYSALLGFSGRRIDVQAGEQALLMSEVHSAVRQLTDAGRPDPVPSHVQVGAPHAELPSYEVSSAPSAAEVSAVRFARRVRFVAPADAVAAVGQLVWIAAVRQRGDVDRLPFLVVGDEPAPTAETAQDVVGICLDLLRRDAVGLRSSLRADNRASLAERVELTERQRTLLMAGAQPIEWTLRRLGASCEPGTELWHCPRPDRHNHGDANASMKVVRGKVSCFRCDAERVDSLRLAIDTLGISPDEAAEWLLDEAELAKIEAVLAAEAAAVEAAAAEAAGEAEPAGEATPAAPVEVSASAE